MLMAWLARAMQARVKVFANICVVGFQIVSYSNWNKAAFIAKLSEDEDPIRKKSLMPFSNFESTKASTVNSDRTKSQKIQIN